MITDLSGLPAFLALAEAGSFRVAAERLGVTRPAVSQALRSLENRLGTALVLRTTRSVSLTEAGRDLYAQVAPAVGVVAAALDAAADREGQPTGQLRIAVSSIAEEVLAGDLIAGFVAAYPGVQLDVTVTDEEFDIVARGFDAGIRLGEVLERDMIAVPASADQRQMVVGAPAYIERRGVPAHPRDLIDHFCIGWRPELRASPYRWEFTEQSRDFDVDVRPQVTTNDMRVMINTALSGAGFTFGLEETFRQHIQSGRLVALLEDYCPSFPGFFLYFPDRRNLAPKLRALVDYVQRWRKERLRHAGDHPTRPPHVSV